MRRSQVPPGGQSSSRPRPVIGPSAGFSLLEVLIALALVGLLMVGLNSFLFSMGEIWGRGSDRRLFDQHVRAVSRYLESELRSAALPPSVAAGTDAVSPKEIRSQAGLTGQLLTFELREGSRLLIWPKEPLPEVECSLAVRDGVGLLLLWHSRLETNFADDSPRETVLSPLVTGIAYEYYEPDFKTWQSESSLRRSRTGDTYDTPHRLKLTFKHGALTQESLISLPVAQEGLPFF